MSATAIDLFCGLGGSSEGARQAGVRVVWAANHNPMVVATHRRNHPRVQHETRDLMDHDWYAVPDTDLIMASPSCTGHTNARGKEKPGHDTARATALAVLQCAEIKRAPAVVVENVTGFRTWELYRWWKDGMRILGYTAAEYVVDAADFGVPQNRERLFVVFTRSASPIVLDLPQRAHVPISTVIDFDGGSWSPVYKRGPRPRSAKTLRQIERARAAGFGDKFLIPYYRSGSGLTGRSIDRPIGTLTTKARWALVDCRGAEPRMRMLAPREAARAQGFPDEYELPQRVADANFGVGNSVCPPVMRDILLAIQRAA